MKDRGGNLDKILNYTPEFLIPIGIRILCWYVGLSDKRNMKKFGVSKVPPPIFRCIVTPSPDMKNFLESGKTDLKNMKENLSKIGKSLSSFGNILEFGCGCGRTARYLKDIKNLSYYGTDIDEEQISWCRKNLKFGEFSVNKPTPPLNYSSNKFDLIFASSVFSHLNEKNQFLWLKELERVTKPKGILVITTMGPDFWKTRRRPREAKNDLEKCGFIFVPRKTFKGISSFQWHTAFHTKEYIYENFSKYFDILKYIPKGNLGLGLLDTTILQKN